MGFPLRMPRSCCEVIGSGGPTRRGVPCRWQATPIGSLSDRIGGTRQPTEDAMQKETLTALVRHHLETASTASSGRSAHTIYGGHEHVLRQTLIALKAGVSLDETKNPGETPRPALDG